MYQRKYQDSLCPEKTLWAAVLKQTWLDLQALPTSYRKDRVHRARMTRLQAESWFADDTTEAPGSLSWICDMLGLNVQYIQKLAWQHVVGAEPLEMPGVEATPCNP